MLLYLYLVSVLFVSVHYTRGWIVTSFYEPAGLTEIFIFLFHQRIGKGAGYKSSELESLKEDESLVIGGKEIQVI